MSSPNQGQGKQARRKVTQENILDVIGKTPLVRINKLLPSGESELFAKLEYLNPGGSVKDRIALWLITDAEKRGVLKPGGTIIEATSGNTGVGLAMVAAIKGYRCIFVVKDKVSEEKIQTLKIFGAEVVITQASLPPEHPESYTETAKRLAREIPNSFHIDQYNNLCNRRCHYEFTGPEILEQLPDIDVFVAGIGTGGTISGVGKFLKEKKPDVKIIAVDPLGSIIHDRYYGKTGSPSSYKVEGIGEDLIPGNHDYTVIDEIIQVNDRESFEAAHSLVRQEGIWTGGSGGAAIAGALKWIKKNSSRKKVVTLLPDSGVKYLSKVYSNKWLSENGFEDLKTNS